MLVLALTTPYLFADRLSARELAQEHDRKIVAALALAKDALIAYAVATKITLIKCPATGPALMTGARRGIEADGCSTRRTVGDFLTN